jgi:hypothetical protein
VIFLLEWGKIFLINFFIFLKVSLNFMPIEQDHTNYTTSREEQNVTVSIGMHSMVLIKWLGVVIVMPPNLFHLFYCLMRRGYDY